MIQQLKINISAAADVKVLAWANHVPVSIDAVINLDLDTDNIVELRQETLKDNTFFYIDSVWLGKLDITNLLHYYGICQVLDINRNKIANFVHDIGSADQVIISISRDIYCTIVQHIDVISVL
jgi:hypothetical protein